MGSKKKNKITRTESAGDGENGKGKQVIADPRFSKVHSDPRFHKLPKHKAKVAIDDRFKRMFTDKRFAGSSAPLDKRGKPRKHSENALRRYYRQEEDEEQENRKKREKSPESEPRDESSESEPELKSESVSESESDVESDVSTSTTDTDDEADDADMIGDDASDEVENVPLIEKETHRLAVVNMDWSQVKEMRDDPSCYEAPLPATVRTPTGNMDSDGGGEETTANNLPVGNQMTSISLHFFGDDEHGADGFSIQIIENMKEEYGLFVWPSSLALAEYVWQQRSRFSGTSVVELGAGTSLPGLVASKVGAEVTLTDDSNRVEVLGNIRKVCDLNKLQCKVAGLTWGVWDAHIFDLHPQIILGADVLYETSAKSQYISKGHH